VNGAATIIIDTHAVGPVGILGDYRGLGGGRPDVLIIL